MHRLRSHFAALVTVAVATAFVPLSYAQDLVDHADDICPPDADPCVITDSFEIEPGSTLNFGIREVQILEGGQLDVGSGHLQLDCGALLVDAGDAIALKVRGPEGFSRQTNGGTLRIETQRTCSLDVDRKCTRDAGCSDGECTKRVCENKFDLPCAENTDCDLGACSVTVCENRDRLCTDSADCSFGPCNFAERKCDGDPGVRCFSDLDCSLGECQIDNPRCENDHGVSCNDHGDCSFGSCSVSVCSKTGGASPRECAIASDCYDGECSVGSGDVEINSPIRADGVYGGIIDIESSGGIIIRGSINAKANPSRDGYGSPGEIELYANGGDIEIEGEIRLDDANTFGYGGELDIFSAQGDIRLAAKINAIGGDGGGGTVEVEADGDVIFEGDIDVSAVGGEGYGGSISAIADGAILLDNDIRLVANGHKNTFGDAGDGGEINFEATSDISMGPNVKMLASGPPPYGNGGIVELYSEEGSITLAGIIELPGKGSDSLAGDIYVTARSGDISIENTATLSALGKRSGGGIVILEGGGNVIVNGALTTTSEITAYAEKDLSIGGFILATDKPDSDGPTVYLEGCAIDLRQGSIVRSASNYSSKNDLRVHSFLNIEQGAELTAEAGTNRLGIVNEENIRIDGTVTPSFETYILTGSDKCSECANSQVDSGETCDDGNATNGDGCNEDCQLESCVAQTADYPAVPLCDDGIACTEDACDIETGNCQSTPDCDVDELCDPLADRCVSESGYCGDGEIDDTEDCDTGETNWSAGKYCNDACEFLACGDPGDDHAHTAADSLFTLNAAIGVLACDICVCDVDENRSITSSDALRMLRFGIGVPDLPLHCPACD